jgi:hypothetical protein
VASYKKETFIQNEYGSNLLGLGQDNIIQVNKEYSEPSPYTITFTPYSILKTSMPTIILSYPITVSLLDDFPADCFVTIQDSDVKFGKCSRVEGTRLVRIEDAFPSGYDKEVQISMKFINPVNNWGKIGILLKTYEVTGQEESLVDQLDTNALIPQLKCDSPCHQCQEDQ